MITAMSPVLPRSPPPNRFDQYRRTHPSASRQAHHQTPQKRYIQYNPSGPKIRDWRKQPSPTKRCRSPTSEPSTDKKDLPSPKRVKKLSPSVVEKVDNLLARSLADEYFTTHHVDAALAGEISSIINEFETFIISQTTPVGIEVQLVPIGSYASGLASKEDSSVDILLPMFGGVSESSDEASLAEAIAGGLHEFSKFDSNGIMLEDTNSIRCRLKDEQHQQQGDTRLPDFLLRVVKATTSCNSPPSSLSFTRRLLHARLLRSYSNCSPLLAPLVCLIRRWGRDNLLSGVGSINNNLTGFQWALLCIAFLQQQQVLPNLHTSRRRGLPVLKYGHLPRQVFSLVSSREEADVFGLNYLSARGDVDDLGNLFVGLLRWLQHVSTTALQQHQQDESIIITISEESTQQPHHGLFLADPLDPNCNIFSEDELSAVLPPLKAAAEASWVRLVQQAIR
ncbi:hypothetical protein FOZ60_004035 [Perkinsus olseni]|uniref:Uncharacterized protein n=1 Tax=Perkinsus olseni TaxID=32597 RepID=A0A7J6NUV8_PEROL|nr:hypothetical protein FOZ60_004035 [Perkinsus olseni]